jgi:hypothetical protein
MDYRKGIKAKASLIIYEKIAGSSKKKEEEENILQTLRIKIQSITLQSFFDITPQKRIA